MADLTTLLNKFLQNLYAGVLDLGGSSTVTIGSGTSVTSVAVGTGTTTALVGGTLFSSTTAASNVGTAETDLITYTMPANTLAVNGRSVRITSWGTYAADATSKVLRGYFGSNSNAPGVTTSTNGLSWWYETIVTRTGASASIAMSNMNNGAVVASVQTATDAIAFNAPIIIKVTGTSATGSNEITALGLIVEAF